MSAKKAGQITIINYGMDETPEGEIIVRGVIDSGSLRDLQVDDYQRERSSISSLSDLVNAFKKGETIPDIELGMRGQKCKDGKGGHCLILQDPVFIVDGLQRVTAAMHVLDSIHNVDVRLGAAVHFGTNENWERERFSILNTLRRKVSPNVLLRNRRKTSPAIQMLYSLTGDKTFVMHDRVCWSQKMRRGELITALMLAKVLGNLCSHKSPTRRNQIDELVPALDCAVEAFGIQNMRDMVRAFFDLVDECWGVRLVVYKDGTSHLKHNFLHVLSRLLADHHDFWGGSNERKLVVEASLRRKIAQFPIMTDPTIRHLASSSGKSRDLLYVMLRDHINSGKRTRRLRPRGGDVAPEVDMDSA